jgi:type I restriction enzyme S subunit
MNHWFGLTVTKWDVVPLREYAFIGTGHTPSRGNDKFWENCNIPWVTVEDLRINGIDSLRPISDTCQKISELGLANSAAVLHPKGTVMLSRTASIGFSCVIDAEMATTQAFVTWTPNKKLLNCNYLNAALMAMRDHYFALAYGATHLTIYFPDLKGLKIPLPPLADQQKIAKFLDYETAKIDTLIAKQQQLIALLKEKRQAVISHAVTKGLNPNAPMRDSGVEWLGEVPAHWDVVPIKYIVSIPVTDGPHETPEFIDEGVPFISAEAVSTGRINFEKIRAHISEEDNKRYSLKYAPKKYDIYMVKSGATTGVTAIVETDSKFNIWSPLAVIRCKEDSYPFFVLNFMRSLNFQEAIELNWSFGTQQNIGMGVIENLQVARPPLEEAKSIVKMLTEKCGAYDLIIEKALIQIELMQERRTALISAAVTGKIDVHDWQVPEPSSNNKKQDSSWKQETDL